MAVSKAQIEGKLQICACGCGTEFRAFGVYRPRSEGGGIRYPEYIRGHHPNCKKVHSLPAWNKGLTKEECPTLLRMGFQVGHKPYNNWDHVNALLRTDTEVREKWLRSKQGKVAWNKGLRKYQYRNGIKSGPDHGNWCGGRRGSVDTAAWQSLRRSVWERDNWTCQQCGDRNHEGRGSRIQLHAHHVVAIAENPHLALDPSNLITLCAKCHRATENYGTKVLHKRRKK